jgi:hypothetical protein
VIATLSIPWRHLIGIGLVFIRKILLPNRMHIQLVMQLSDTITDRVVYSIHFLLNEWNGDDEGKMIKMSMLGLKNSFQWKTLTSNVGSNK